MPRKIHIVPSVMMNGCTRRPTISRPLTSPQARPMPTRAPSDQMQRRGVAGCHARNASAIATPASAKTEPTERSMPPEMITMRRADGHDGEEGGVRGGLQQRVGVEEVVDLSPGQRVDVTARQHRQQHCQQQDHAEQPQLLHAQEPPHVSAADHREPLEKVTDHRDRASAHCTGTASTRSGPRAEGTRGRYSDGTYT